MQDDSSHDQRRAVLELIELCERWEGNLTGSRVRSLLTAMRVRFERFAVREWGAGWAACGTYHLRDEDWLAFCLSDEADEPDATELCSACARALVALTDLRNALGR
jgi:hypothetical protein